MDQDFMNSYRELAKRVHSRKHAKRVIEEFCQSLETYGKDCKNSIQNINLTWSEGLPFLDNSSAS